MKRSILGLLAPALLAVSVPSARAQWVPDGNPVCTAAAAQQNVASTTDRNGGSIMVWQDLRSDANGDIYTRRIDAYGAGQWGTNGMPICTASGIQQFAQVSQDAFGIVYWLWEDQRAGNKDVYYAVGDLNGNVYTPANGR